MLCLFFWLVLCIIIINEFYFRVRQIHAVSIPSYIFIVNTRAMPDWFSFKVAHSTTTGTFQAPLY